MKTKEECKKYVESRKPQTKAEAISYASAYWKQEEKKEIACTKCDFISSKWRPTQSIATHTWRKHPSEHEGGEELIDRLIDFEMSPEMNKLWIQHVNGKGGAEIIMKRYREFIRQELARERQRTVEEYLQVIIWLAKAYQANFDEFYPKANATKEQIDVYMNFTTIQGSDMRFLVEKLSKIDINKEGWLKSIDFLKKYLLKG